MMITKVCTKCGVEKPLGEYHKHKNGKYGVRSECKTCLKQNYKDNKEKRKEYSRKYYLYNSDRVKVNARKWRNDNPEKAKEYVAKWKNDNPEKAKEHGAKWWLNNIEKGRVYQRKWACANSKKIAEYARRSRDRLAPAYVRGVIVQQYNIDTAEITPDTIEMKRRSLKYYRELNQLKKLTK